MSDTKDQKPQTPRPRLKLTKYHVYQGFVDGGHERTLILGRNLTIGKVESIEMDPISGLVHYVCGGVSYVLNAQGMGEVAK